MSKQNKTIKSEENNTKNTYSGKIKGTAMLIVVASICYSTAVIVMGTEGVTPLVFLIPQALFAVTILISKFSK